MADFNKWRSNADKLLAAPVLRRRSMTSVVGRVEDRFAAVYPARERGMPWEDIAAALKNGDNITSDAVQSAFKRICAERGIAPPTRPGAKRSARAITKPQETIAAAPEVDLFGGTGERWVDDGE